MHERGVGVDRPTDEITPFSSIGKTLELKTKDPGWNYAHGVGYPFIKSYPRPLKKEKRVKKEQQQQKIKSITARTAVPRLK